MSDTNADRAADGGSARYAQRSGSGANEPKQHERKEQHEDWVPRQGGDQSRPGKETGGGSGDEPTGSGPGPSDGPTGGGPSGGEEVGPSEGDDRSGPAFEEG